jgi:hypothetical protein
MTAEVVPSVYRKGIRPGVPPPTPTWCVWGKSSVFNRLEAWFHRKLLVFKNLEARFLKPENLRELIYEKAPGATALAWSGKQNF